MIRRVTALCAAAVALSAAIPAGADTLPQGGGANNIVIVKAASDWTQPIRTHTQIAQAGGPAVESANIATATATGCTGCTSTAVAVQVVFVTGSPELFEPGNVAAAANSGCNACGTFAYAWQYVVQVDGPAHLSPEGQLRTRALEQQIDDAAASLSPTTLDNDLALQAQLDSLTSQLREVVDSEIEQGNVNAQNAPRMHKRVTYRPA
jgi:hypothetical protein